MSRENMPAKDKGALSPPAESATLIARAQHNALNLIAAAQEKLNSIPICEPAERYAQTETPHFKHADIKDLWVQELTNLLEATQDRFALISEKSPSLESELEAIAERVLYEKMRIDGFKSDADYCALSQKELDTAKAIIESSNGDKKSQALFEDINNLQKKLDSWKANELEGEYWKKPDLEKLLKLKMSIKSFLAMVGTIYNQFGYGENIADLQYQLFEFLKEKKRFRLLSEVSLFIKETLDAKKSDGIKPSQEETFEAIANKYPEIITALANEHTADPLRRLATEHLLQTNIFHPEEDFILYPITAAKNVIDEKMKNAEKKTTLIKNLDSVLEALKQEISEADEKIAVDEVSETSDAQKEILRDKAQAALNLKIRDAKKVAYLHFNLALILCGDQTEDEKRQAIHEHYLKSTSLFERLSEGLRVLIAKVRETLTFSIRINTSSISTTLQLLESEPDTDTQSEADGRSSPEPSPEAPNYAECSPRFFHSHTEMKKTMRDAALEALAPRKGLS